MADERVMEEAETKRLEKAIYEALHASGPSAFIGEFQPGREITIDGAFNLRSVAKHLLSRLPR
jgi:hypothetical protein